MKKPTYETLESRIKALEAELDLLNGIDQKLRNEHRLLLKIMDTAKEGICIGYRLSEFPYIQFTLWNERMTEMTGYSKEAMNTLGWYQEMYSDPDTRSRAMAGMERLFQGENFYTENIELDRSDGQKRFIKVIGSVIDFENDDSKVLLMLYDNTDEKRNEHQLYLAHKELESRVAERTAELMALNQQLTKEIEERKQLETKLKCHEKKLIEAQKELDFLVRTSPDIIYRLDPEGKIVFINDTVLEYGWTPEELMGKTIIELVHPDDREKAFYKVKERRTGHRRTRSFELRILTKGKSTVSFEMKSRDCPDHISVELDAEGIYASETPQKESFIGSHGIARDISQRKRMEKALQKSEAFKRAMLNGISLNLVFINHDFEIIYANDAAAKFADMTISEMIGKKCFQIRANRNMPCKDCPANLSFKTGCAQQAVITTPDGRIWEKRAEPVYDGEMFLGVLEIGQDVTEKKKAERQLRESEEKYRLVVENSNDAIFIAQDDVIKFPNPQTLAITGCSEQELLERPFSIFIHPDDRDMVCERYRQILEGETEPETYAFRIINKDGKTVWIRSNTIVIQWDGRPATLNFVSDITAEKQKLTRLLDASKMESIATMAGGIAHDYNNLLYIVMGNIGLAEELIPKSSEAHTFLQSAMDALQLTKDLTHKIVTFAKGNAPRKRVGSIGNLLEETAKQMLSISTCQWSMQVSPELWHVEFDKIQLRHVFEEILNNALTFIRKDPPTIAIDARNVWVTQDHPHSPIISQGPYVRVSIQDRGIGIAPKNLKKIFDPYFSTKELGTQKGTGLGLSLARSIVHKHEGEIVAASELNKGTMFHIYLPRSPSADVSSDQVSVTETDVICPLDPGVKRVLVLDDEKMVRELMNHILKRCGFEPAFAASGTEAIQIYKQAMDSGCPFSVVILDLTVKGGIGGKDVLQHLIRIDPQVNAIISSGYSNDRTIAHYKQFGFKGVLVKPYTQKELKAELGKVLAITIQ